MSQRYHAGPIVWVAVVAITLLSLYLFQSILWLIIPSLFAVILYYVAEPVVKNLMYWGMTRSRACVIVMGTLVLLMLVLSLLFLPMFSQDLASWKLTIEHYLDGG